MVIDYTLEPFWVPDLHPRSQERPPKSRTGSWQKKNQNQNFQRFSVFREISQLLIFFFFVTIFEKVTGKISEIYKKNFFYIFRFVGGQNSGKDPKQGRSPK